MESKRDSIYDLIDVCGDEDNDSHTVVLKELIKFLPTDTIVEFVEDFKRHHNIMGYNDHEICMSCQATHDTNDDHICEEDDTDSIDEQETIFFSSRIPEC
jgi:hypothetical protein